MTEAKAAGSHASPPAEPRWTRSTRNFGTGWLVISLLYL